MDDFHGTKVSDPYRWLEEQDSVEGTAWLGEQERLSRGYLDALPDREKLADRLRELYSHERRGVPVYAADRSFELRSDPSGAPDALWVTESDGCARRLFQPADGVSVSVFSPSSDGRLVAVAVSPAGSDWQSVLVLQADNGGVIGTEVHGVKLAVVEWLEDSSAFVYAAFTLTGEADRPFVQQVRLHRPGSPDDEVLFEAPPDVVLVRPHTRHGQLAVEVMRSFVPTEILLGPIGSPLRSLVAGTDPVRFVDIVGDEVVVQSHAGAPNGRIVAMPLHGTADPRVIVAEAENQLDVLAQSSFVIAGHVVTVGSSGMGSTVMVSSLDGSGSYPAPLPAGGTVPLLWDPVRSTGTDGVFTLPFTSPTTPRGVLEHDIATRTSRVRFAPQLEGYRPEEYTVEAVEVPAGDTQVPVQLVYRNGLPPGQPRPVLLSAYGGFGLCLSAFGFQPWHVPWLEVGGVIVLAGVRGGGERGPQWHAQGRLQHKQNTFDDTIAVAQWLIEQGWTTAAQLALTGMSNGGLLTGAVLTQRPDLFAAVVPEIALLDMLRYHRFPGADAWTAEYGSADNPAEFATLHAYSPLHNLLPDREYPATLILTADHDDRVPPGVHSFKFTAALQHAQAGAAPVLLRVAHGAGHGQGRSLEVEVTERTDMLAFLLAATSRTS